MHNQISFPFVTLRSCVLLSFSVSVSLWQICKMFLPINKEEAKKRGWDQLDIIFVTGDAYVDHPSFGVPLLARLLESRGFRVGIISQPDWRDKDSFTVLGRPRLFFAVSAGAMDSMVAHYTPARKLRHDDAYTPGDRHGGRPNRAVIVYTSRIKEAYKDAPVVIGGIEASLRRFAHYDFWEDKVRRSILFDAKADLLVYGMGEAPILEVAERIRDGQSIRVIQDVRGTAYIARAVPEGDGILEIPSFEEAAGDKSKYSEAFRLVSQEMNPFCGKTIVQKHGDRVLICNPPSFPLSRQEMDRLYALPFEKMPHPSYREAIPAWEQIRSSITTHRGCFGGCAFCAITHHQGKIIQSRSQSSITDEVGRLQRHTWFKGSVSDIGGPTANMYGILCRDEAAKKSCRRESCLFPRPCKNLGVSAKEGARLLKEVRRLEGVLHVSVSSGIRYDLLRHQPEYFQELLAHHVGGLLKVAPEHTVDHVTALMRKPGRQAFEEFLTQFARESRGLGKKQFVIPYLMSGHPGCTLSDMVELALFLKRRGLRVEQVQDFTPTPGTLSTCMYYTGEDPHTGKKVYVPKTDREKILQKSLLLYHRSEQRRNVLDALRQCGREDAAAELLGKNRKS